ncbi:MAG: hypothetical protein K6U80_20290 [Firmicutes bacterium]|nr:hypothetical protein [Bacillota bacterium]
MSFRKMLIFIVISGILILFSGCLSGIKVVGIQHLSPKGNDLKSWGDNNVDDGRPSYFDLVVILKNNSPNLMKSQKVHVELWFAKAKDIFTGEADTFSKEVEEVRKNSKWYLVMEKNIIVKEIKPFKTKKVKVANINIWNLIEREFNKDQKKNFNSIVTAWRTKAIANNSMAEKKVMIDITF